MKIETCGKYVLTEDRTFRGSICIGQFPKGFVFTVTQISKEYNKVLTNELYDWQYNNIPCESYVESEIKNV